MNFRKEGKPWVELFEKYGRVMYIPLHAYNDTTHPDCEIGFVSSITDKYVFVRFAKQLARLGWERTTSQACEPESLKILEGHWPEVTF